MTHCTLIALEHTPTGEALLGDAEYYERRHRGMGEPRTAVERERKALYAALAQRSREAFGRLQELAAQRSIRAARGGHDVH